MDGALCEIFGTSTGGSLAAPRLGRSPSIETAEWLVDGAWATAPDDMLAPAKLRSSCLSESECAAAVSGEAVLPIAGCGTGSASAGWSCSGSGCTSSSSVAVCGADPPPVAAVRARPCSEPLADANCVDTLVSSREVKLVDCSAGSSPGSETSEFVAPPPRGSGALVGCGKLVRGLLFKSADVSTEPSISSGTLAASGSSSRTTD
mmetsp:Transcript_49670/g.94923  ORF Transcript_49670/g.94923 Transcript_49670/m.94923 type:complete len:205 (+) Transcript_49670:819-1433(+)